MTLKLDPVDRAPHLSTLVASSITREIAEGRLKPGDQLPTEQELAKNFGVSRNVIREAIARLRSEKRIWSQQGRGAFVADTPSASVLTMDFRPGDGDDFRALFEMRRLMEVEAAGLAAERRSAADVAAMRTELDHMAASLYGSIGWLKGDLDFHAAVAAATGNIYMSQFLVFVAERVRESILATGRSQRSDDVAAITFAEHRRIVDAIDAGDGEAARAAMRDHLAGAAVRLGLTAEGG